MCGLAFLFDPERPRDGQERAMRLALDRIHYRGPDASGITCGDTWTLGHVRLSIIDLEASEQPMSDEMGRFVLAFNGEIYNYRELRASLENRWKFKTHGDTEVLLAGLVLEGAAFLRRSEGMWAFVMIDRDSDEVLLGRDRMGKKPLFFEVSQQRLSCASELRGLRALSDEPWSEDEDSAADYFRYGYCLPGNTHYRSVKEVLPGHVARWRPSAKLVQERYWQIAPVSFSGSADAAARKLTECFEKAVERRLVADVEVGAFLSGGIDSSLIVALMAQRLGRTPKTFTIGFDDRHFDEREAAESIARHFGTEHHSAMVDALQVSDLESLVLDHVGQPFADSSLLPTAKVCALAAQHVKVALSGDGGDELFCGYQRYQARLILQWYTRLPRGLRNAAEAAVKALPEPMAHHSRSVLKKAHLFVGVASRIEAETPYVGALLNTPQQLRELAPDLAGRGHTAPALPESCEPDDVARMMMADALVYLPQDILVKVDRASMAHSLETRAPFLDSNLVNLAFSLPRRWHRRSGLGKKMLRTSFAQLLPEHVWTRNKQGFAVPVHSWFRGDLGERLMMLAQQTPHHGLDVHAIGKLLKQHRTGCDMGYRLWGIYTYLLWKTQSALV